MDDCLPVEYRQIPECKASFQHSSMQLKMLIDMYQNEELDNMKLLTLSSLMKLPIPPDISKNWVDHSPTRSASSTLNRPASRQPYRPASSKPKIQMKTRESFIEPPITIPPTDQVKHTLPHVWAISGITVGSQGLTQNGTIKVLPPTQSKNRVKSPPFSKATSSEKNSIFTKSPKLRSSNNLNKKGHFLQEGQVTTVDPENPNRSLTKSQVIIPTRIAAKSPATSQTRSLKSSEIGRTRSAATSPTRSVKSPAISQTRSAVKPLATGTPRSTLISPAISATRSAAKSPATSPTRPSARSPVVSPTRSGSTNVEVEISSTQNLSGSPIFSSQRSVISNAAKRSSVRSPAISTTKSPATSPIRSSVKSPAISPTRSSVRSPAISPARSPVISPTRSSATGTEKRLAGSKVLTSKTSVASNTAKIPAKRSSVRDSAISPTRSPVISPTRSPVISPTRSAAIGTEKGLTGSPVLTSQKSVASNTAKIPTKRSSVGSPAISPTRSTVRSPVISPTRSVATGTEKRLAGSPVLTSQKSVRSNTANIPAKRSSVRSPAISPTKSAAKTS